MENVTLAIVASIVITALYAVMKYAERYYGPNPEAWDQKKFLQLIVVAFVLVIAAYYSQGVVQMPDTSLIEQAMAILGAAVFALTGIKFGVNASTSGTRTTAATISAPPTDEGITSFGFTILPAFLEGKSPYIAIAKITCSQSVAAVMVAWTDGIEETYSLVQEGEYYVVNIVHEYKYVYDGKYTGHTYYPEITIVGKNGKTQKFNTETTGRCFSVYVMA